MRRVHAVGTEEENEEGEEEEESERGDAREATRKKCEEYEMEE